MLREELLVRQQHALLRLAVPEQQPASGAAVVRRPAHHDRLAVRMRQQLVRAVDGRSAPGEETRVGGLVVRLRRNPRPGWVPFQQEAARVSAGEEALPLPAYGIPL